MQVLQTEQSNNPRELSIHFKPEYTMNTLSAYVSKSKFTEYIKRFTSRKNNEKIIDTLLASYEIQLTFCTHFQIWHRNENNEPKVKEIKGDKFQKSYRLQKTNNRIELMAFVQNPTQLADQQITLTIKIEDKEVESLTFDIPNDKSYSGWYKISTILGESNY
jgi:hypothetical protein